jgi:type I restriction enzyme S subunit
VFYEATIPLPPLVEQRRIVDLVSSVDAYIDSLQQQVDSARAARNAVLHDLLSAGGNDWTETSLGKISTNISTRVAPENLEIEIPYIGLEHVDPRTSLISKWGEIESVSSSVAPFEPGDVLFGRLRPYLHKVAFATFPGVCSPEILVLRAREGCEPGFLHLICSADSTITACVEMSAGTRMPRTSATDLASILISLPPLDEQMRIVELISSMDELVAASEQSIAHTKNLRSGLLSDLLSGEHEIPKSYDKLLGD